MNDDIKAIRDALAALNGEDAAWAEVDNYRIACHPERIARLLDALESATKDAERYRWLRLQARLTKLQGVQFIGIGLGSGATMLEMLDAGIDAAMKGAS